MLEDAGNSERSRRNVLKSAAKAGVGAGAIVTAGAGAVTAIPACAVANGDDGSVTVHENCGTDPIAEVPNGETGEVKQVCRDANGAQVLYVIWDADWPTGWVYGDEIGSCQPGDGDGDGVS